MNTTRDRAWLRSFLRLGARAEQDNIPASDVERQENTVLRALEMLDDRPGLVLADEVGMGKTFEALGVAAAFRHAKPRARIVVITPGPDLTTKWHSEFSRFTAMYDFGGQVVEARALRDFVEKVRSNPIVVAPVTMFQSGRGSEAQTFILSLYFHWKKQTDGLHGKTANAIMSRYRDGDHDRVDVRSKKFLGTFELAELEPHLKKAFQRGPSGGAAGLDDIFETEGLTGFENQRLMKAALYRARFVLVGALIPAIDLLVVDEAHKLKNPGSLRTRAMRQVFHRRFSKALFLTATPFQLDVGELREVFRLFAEAKSAPKKLVDEIADLLTAVREYQAHYDEFQSVWSALDPGVAAEFSRAYDAAPAAIDQLEDPSLRLVASQVRELSRLKREVIEPGFRRWMIRSLREGKRVYRDHHEHRLETGAEAAFPFLIYERFIAELFRRKRQTHKAAVEINMVSSYAAARGGALLAEGEFAIPPEAKAYHALLRDVLEDIGDEHGQHPKFSFVVADALEAAARGQKTLVFCSRVATLEQLRRDLDQIWEQRLVERWRAVYPDAAADNVFDRVDEDESRKRGRHSLLQRRFHRSQDSLYLALRERYLRTAVPIADFALQHLDAVVRLANEKVGAIRVGQSSATRLDYQVAKRCIEQAAAELWVARSGRGSVNEKALTNMLAPEFLTLGLDLCEDPFENDSVGNHRPTWVVDERVARLVIGERSSLWAEITEQLDMLEIELRVQLVEQLARYLTFKQVPFLPDLLAAAKDTDMDVASIRSADMLAFVDRFWHQSAGFSWLCQVQAFLEYFVSRDPQHRREILDGPIRTGEFARHTKDGESRERLREAFNTPLYPMVLIANEVMQEGLDLHRNCRRVVH